jgi:hypothetical protein
MGDGQFLCVEFRVPEHPHFAVTFEHSIRHRVLTGFANRGVGPLVGAGTGQGWIGYTFHVQDAEKARLVVDEVMASVMPNQRYKTSLMGKYSVCPTAR